MYTIQIERADRRGAYQTAYRADTPEDAQRLFQRARGECPRTHRVRLVCKRPDGSRDRARPQYGLA